VEALRQLHDAIERYLEERCFRATAQERPNPDVELREPAT
jgi:hypothetical protein